MPWKLITNVTKKRHGVPETFNQSKDYANFDGAERALYKDLLCFGLRHAVIFNDDDEDEDPKEVRSNVPASIAEFKNSEFSVTSFIECLEDDHLGGRKGDKLIESLRMDDGNFRWPSDIATEIQLLKLAANDTEGDVVYNFEIKPI
jgi:hypothetical protein